MNHVPVAALAAAAIVLPRIAAAQDADPAASIPCAPVATLRALSECAFARSETVRRARDEVAAIHGRRMTAGHLLPANPTVEISGGRRRTETGRIDADRGIDLSQRIEIGGQRGPRVGIARTELEVATSALAAAERDLLLDLAEAVVAVERARAETRFAAEEIDLGARLVDISSGRVKQGLGAALDEDLAQAAWLKARRSGLLAAQYLKETETNLARAVGADVQLAVGAELPRGFEPDADLPDLERRALEEHHTVRKPLADSRAARLRLDLLRRERVPDVTLAAIAKHEELGDVVGGRLSIPLPLFRRNQGAIAEQQARIAQADTAATHAHLRVQLEVRAAYEGWKRALALLRAIPDGIEARLSGDVESLRSAYGRGAMPLVAVLASLREAFAARRTIVDAKADALMASFELARATASRVTLTTSGGGL